MLGPGRHDLLRSAIHGFDPERGGITQVTELHNPSYAASLLEDGTMVITTRRSRPDRATEIR